MQKKLEGWLGDDNAIYKFRGLTITLKSINKENVQSIPYLPT